MQVFTAAWFILQRLPEISISITKTDRSGYATRMQKKGLIAMEKSPGITMFNHIISMRRFKH